MWEDTAEDEVWKTIDPDNIWVLDKLILSRKCGYNCGPVGQDVPHPGNYIVRPCVNMMGLGLGTQIVNLEKETVHLPVGHFWCEIFEGRHLSVDYSFGIQQLCVEGFKSPDTFIKWDKWQKTNDIVPFPTVLLPFVNHSIVNCEFVGGNLIEAHFRHNEDFADGIETFIPVWEGQSTTPPEGFTYRKYPDIHGRIGAFVR